MCFVLYISIMLYHVYVWFFFFKQKTAYEMRISDWSSDVCSSDLADQARPRLRADGHQKAGEAERIGEQPDPPVGGKDGAVPRQPQDQRDQIGRAACRER